MQKFSIWLRPESNCWAENHRQTAFVCMPGCCLAAVHIMKIEGGSNAPYFVYLRSFRSERPCLSVGPYLKTLHYARQDAANVPLCRIMPRNHNRPKRAIMPINYASLQRLAQVRREAQKMILLCVCKGTLANKGKPERRQECLPPCPLARLAAIRAGRAQNRGS